MEYTREDLHEIFREETKDETKDGVRECVCSWMGTVCDTTSQEFITEAVVHLEANRDNTAWIDTRMADTLTVAQCVCSVGQEQARRARQSGWCRASHKTQLGSVVQEQEQVPWHARNGYDEVTI